MTPLKEVPQYVEKIDRLNRISVAIAQIESRILELNQMAVAPAKKAALEDAALQYAETGVVAHVAVSPGEIQREREALTSQLEVLKLSADAMRQQMHELQQQLSRQVCAAQAPAHRKLAQRMLKLLREIDDVQEDERQLLLSIHAAGYEPSFPQSVAWPLIGRASDNSGSALFYRVRELGHYAD